MDIDRILNGLWKSLEKNTIITDSDGKAVYVSGSCERDPREVLEKISVMPVEAEEMEFFDLNIRINMTKVEDDGETYLCYTFTDISEYTSLVREISSYTKTLSSVADFQASVMSRLNMSYDMFLPGLSEYCGTDDVMMIMKTKRGIKKSIYNGEITRINIYDEEKYKHYLDMKAGSFVDGVYCIASSAAQGNKYSVLIRPKGDDVDLSKYSDSSILSVITLFIENCVMRERIISESEHDKLTGLYNKGKYLSLKKNNFGSPKSIAIYNFDVNNLKHINDTYGHEFGDVLIIKAAESIAAVTSEKVLGFRMGGDEYLMIGIDLTEEQAVGIYERWKKELARLNFEDLQLFCAMACGFVYASGDYDYDEAYTRADALMYENKKELKEKGIYSYLKTIELPE